MEGRKGSLNYSSTYRSGLDPTQNGQAERIAALTGNDSSQSKHSVFCVRSGSAYLLATPRSQNHQCTSQERQPTDRYTRVNFRSRPRWRRWIWSGWRWRRGWRRRRWGWWRRRRRSRSWWWWTGMGNRAHAESQGKCQNRELKQFLHSSHPIYVVVSVQRLQTFGYPAARSVHGVPQRL
jgi:hypothetical protein